MYFIPSLDRSEKYPLLGIRLHLFWIRKYSLVSHYETMSFDSSETCISSITCMYLDIFLKPEQYSDSIYRHMQQMKKNENTKNHWRRPFSFFSFDFCLSPPIINSPPLSRGMGHSIVVLHSEKCNFYYTCSYEILCTDGAWLLSWSNMSRRNGYCEWITRMENYESITQSNDLPQDMITPITGPTHGKYLTSDIHHLGMKCIRKPTLFQISVNSKCWKLVFRRFPFMGMFDWGGVLKHNSSIIFGLF